MKQELLNEEEIRVCQTIGRDEVNNRTCIALAEFDALCRTALLAAQSKASDEIIARISDLEPTRINSDYWLGNARRAESDASILIYAEQAINAWKNAAYVMADQRDQARKGNPAKRLEIASDISALITKYSTKLLELDGANMDEGEVPLILIDFVRELGAMR